MKVLYQLAFLSYYRYSFFLMDVLLFLWIGFGFYHLTYKILPQFIPETKQVRWERARKVLSVSLIVQLCCIFFLVLVLFVRKPILVHFQTNAGISGVVFVVWMVLRLINTLLVGSFLASCWMFLDKDAKTTIMVQRWFVFMTVLLVVSLWSMTYMLSPRLNRALRIYEMFYHIRNLYLIRDPEKKYKTFLFLQQQGCIPPAYFSLYRDEWKRTFKGQVMEPLDCVFFHDTDGTRS